MQGKGACAAYSACSRLGKDYQASIKIRLGRLSGIVSLKVRNQTRASQHHLPESECESHTMQDQEPCEIRCDTRLGAMQGQQQAQTAKLQACATCPGC
eukprot:1160362-Pelagomonas_calceolata.AAC.3